MLFLRASPHAFKPAHAPLAPRRARSLGGAVPPGVVRAVYRGGPSPRDVRGPPGRSAEGGGRESAGGLRRRRQ